MKIRERKALELRRALPGEERGNRQDPMTPSDKIWSNRIWERSRIQEGSSCRPRRRTREASLQPRRVESLSAGPLGHFTTVALIESIYSIFFM